MLLFIAAMVAFILAPLEAIRRFAAPPERLLAGPLYGGGLVIGPPLVLLLCVTIGLSWAMGGRGRTRRPQEEIDRRLESIVGKPAAALVAACAIVYLYGLAAFWYVTPEGVQVHPRWFAATRLIPWADVRRRHIACHRGKRDFRWVEFRVEFASGEAYDLSSTQRQDVTARFATLFALTKGAETTWSSFRPDVCRADVYSVVSPP